MPLLPGLLAILLACIFPRAARADFIIHYWQDHHERQSTFRLSINQNYYYSTSNFDNVGNITSPAGLRNYTRVQSDLVIDYGLLERLTLYSRTSWAYLNVNSSTLPGTGYGFADQTIGVNYRVLNSHSRTQPHPSPPIFLDLQLQMDFPAYSTTSASASGIPFLGDGSTDLTAGVFGGVPVYVNQTEAVNAILGVGYTSRSNNFSSAIPWSATLQYSPYEDGIEASATLIGLSSLRTDPNGASGTIRSSSGAGGSFYIGGTNPSLFSLRGSIGYKFDADMKLTLYATQSVWGQAAPQGLNMALGFQTRWGGSGKKNPVLLSPNQYRHSNQGFVRYSLDSRVLKSNDRMSLVKIDKGSQDGIERGQVFDIFYVNKDGSIGEAIARGQVISVKPEEAALDITEYYREVLINEGFIAKRVIQ